jgi:uroporphyrinogen-III synthase
MAFAVLTRDDCDDYRAPLAAIGLDVVAMPVTAAFAIDGPLAVALSSGEYAAIVVASRRAAAQLAALGHRGLPEVWVVGEATGKPLELAGIATIHPPAAVDGASLARELVAARRLAGRRVLVPRSADGRPEAIDILRDAGAVVDDVIVYRMERVAPDSPMLDRGKELLRAGKAAICAVFAPSQAAALAALLGSLDRLVAQFVAIGQTTASSLKSLGILDVAVALTPTPEGIARAVASVYPPR